MLRKPNQNGSFQRVSFMQYKQKQLHIISPLKIVAAFSNLVKLALILEVISQTKATIECTFSSMKLIKARLCSRLGEAN